MGTPHWLKSGRRSFVSEESRSSSPGRMLSPLHPVDQCPRLQQEVRMTKALDIGLHPKGDNYESGGLVTFTTAYDYILCYISKV